MKLILWSFPFTCISYKSIHPWTFSHFLSFESIVQASLIIYDCTTFYKNWLNGTWKTLKLFLVTEEKERKNYKRAFSNWFPEQRFLFTIWPRLTHSHFHSLSHGISIIDTKREPSKTTDWTKTLHMDLALEEHTYGFKKCEQRLHRASGYSLHCVLWVLTLQQKLQIIQFPVNMLDTCTCYGSYLRLFQNHTCFLVTRLLIYLPITVGVDSFCFFLTWLPIIAPLEIMDFKGGRNNKKLQQNSIQYL